MASEENSTKENNLNLTPRDYDLLARALMCIKGEFAIDYDKFANLAGFKNSNSSKASWHSLKKKLDKMTSNGASPSSEPGTPSSANAKRKKKTDEGADDGSEEGESSSPAKKNKKTPAKSAKKVAESNTDDASDEASSSPSKEAKTAPAKGKKSGKVKAETCTGDNDAVLEDSNGVIAQSEEKVKSEQDGEKEALLARDGEEQTSSTSA